MKVIFVGIHNKYNLKPLDSSTKTGKVIDRIIHSINDDEITFVKTNLFNCDGIPSQKSERDFHASAWKRENKPDNITNMIVILGKDVHQYFIEQNLIWEITLSHPGAIRGKAIEDIYVENAVRRIVHLKAKFI